MKKCFYCGSEMTPQSTELCSLYLKLDELNHEWLGLIIEYLDNMLQKQSNEVIKTKMSTKTQEIKQIIDIIGLLKNRSDLDSMSDSSYNTAKTPINELCKQALEHYLKLSDEACHYNSLIPEAIELYRKTHIEKCDNCKWNKPPDDCKLGREPETNMPICSSFNSGYDLSEQTRTDMNDETVRQKQNPAERNRTDVVKSSQLGFEVPEDEAEV